jgi:hypothetical protein
MSSGREALAERIGWGNQDRYWMPPASPRELRSDASSSGQIIVQRPTIFKSLCPALAGQKCGRTIPLPEVARPKAGTVVSSVTCQTFRFCK